MYLQTYKQFNKSEVMMPSKELVLVGYDFYSRLKCSIACAYLSLYQTHACLVRPLAKGTRTGMAGSVMAGSAFSADLPILCTIYICLANYPLLALYPEQGYRAESLPQSVVVVWGKKSTQATATFRMKVDCIVWPVWSWPTAKTRKAKIFSACK